MSRSRGRAEDRHASGEGMKGARNNRIVEGQDLEEVSGQAGSMCAGAAAA